MDEDEECLLESSSLNMYLQNLGFSDVQVTKNEAANLVNKYKASLAKSNFPVEVIDKDVIDQVEVITSTKLLFEEDFSIVEILLSNFKVLNNGVLKIMFQDLSGVVVVFLGLCFYFVIGYYALVIISPFYAYKCADYFSRKHFDKIKVKNLVKVLRRNSTLLKTSVNLIKTERDRFLLLQVNHTQPSFQEKQEVHFYFYNRFRSDFLSIVNEMISILVNSTRKLIKTIPLIDYADTPEYYLCCNLEKNFTLDDPSKLCLLYMLVQSEFLRRIILSLIPNLHLFPKGNFNKLERVLKETTVNLTKVNKTLGYKFDFAFHQGFKEAFEITKAKGAPGNEYEAEFISSIQDITNTFTKLLLNCRLIEESFMSDKFPQNVEAKLVTLQTAIKDCQRNIEKSFILLKKANAVSDSVKQEMVQEEESAVNDYQKNTEISSLEKMSAESNIMAKEEVNLQEEEIKAGDDNFSRTKVGYTDLAWEVEDDVFEAYISKENQNADINVDDWDLDEVLKENLKKEFSQNVMKELKGRLVEKAKNWKKRELNILKKKGLIDNNNEDLLKDEVDDVNDVEDEIEHKKNNAGTCCEETFFEEPEHYQEIKNTFIKTTDEDACLLDDHLETQHCFGNICKEFLKDLNETRKLILTSPIAEEEFCLCTTDEEPFDDQSTE